MSTATEPTATSVHEVVHEDTHTNPTRTIAIAVDQSLFAQKAFDWALDNLIRPDSDQVVLMNVRPYVTAPVMYSAPMMDLGADLMISSDEYQKLDESNKLASHDLIRKYAASLLKKGIKCKGIALRGDAREELVYKVEDIKADILVIGSRGMGALKRVFIGSTSDYCIHNCKATVIVPKK